MRSIRISKEEQRTSFCVSRVIESAALQRYVAHDVTEPEMHPTQTLDTLSAKDRSPADIEGSPLHEVLKQPFLLGLFLPLQNGGWSPSLLERTTDWRFDYNAALTLHAEALGFDLVFGLAQWMPKGGHGGSMSYRENSIDPFITTAALSAVTKRILLLSTIHVLYGPWHPLHLACTELVCCNDCDMDVLPVNFHAFGPRCG
jgi:hypothetical protein